MPLPPLDRRRLQVFVFGPGTGELVLVRAPPDDWLVIDGCAARGQPYGLQVLEHYRAQPKIVIFTHPHLDHARGVARVVDDATKGPTESWPKLGMVPCFEHVLEREDAGVDPASEFERSATQQAVAAIADRWERSPACKWPVAFGTAEALGDATLRVLSPHSSILNRNLKRLRAGKRIDWNTMATALLLEWKGRRVLLGSDLVEEPEHGWHRAHSWWAEIAQHEVAKVPHHGSVRALHAKVLGGEGPAVVTPFAASGLPDFASSGGVRWLHRHGREVLLTGLPRAHAVQAGAPATLRRQELANEPDMLFDPTTPGFPDCFVCASLGEDGATAFEFGPGSVRVTA